MKNLYFACFLVLLSANLSAQSDWDIFPNNQKTYFQNELNELDLYYNDSTEIWNGLTTNYLNVYSLVAPYEDCFYDFLFYALYELPEYIIDFESTINSDSNHYYSPYFTFFQHTEPGESWTFDSPLNGVSDFQITCLEKTLETFLGYEDSVKIFSIQALNGNNPTTHPFNDFEFKLSKTAGFIEFIPVEWFKYSTLPDDLATGAKKIYGFEKDTIYGFMNRFEDYFHHFESGEIYEWYSESWDGFKYKESWRWDSITNVDITAEGVNLEVFRTQFHHLIPDINFPNIDTTYTTVETVTETTERQFIEPFFQSATQSLYPMQDFGSFLSGNQASLVPHIPKVLANGQIYEYLKSYDSHIIHLGNCQIGQTTDVSHSASYKSGIGLVRKGSGWGWGMSNYDTLICYTKNGVLFGENCEPILNTSTRDVSKNSLPIQIVPNPAVSSIFVKSPSEELHQQSWQILDYQGKTVKKGQFTGNAYEIDVETLLSGFYFLKIEIDGQWGVEKFIKQ